jgi:TonB family protein
VTPFAMLYTVAVGVPIAWAALALAAVLRRSGRPERGVWFAALVLSLAVPALALINPGRQEASVATLRSADAGVIRLPDFVVVPTQGPSLDWGRIALLVWLVVSAAMAIRWAAAAYQLSRASRSWSQDTIDGVLVWLTENIGPAVSGTFRPRVLAPSWLCSLPSQQRSLVLMHEEEHIRARDPLLVAFTRVARIVAPWNPVVWVLTSRLVRAVELDCDRRVLRRTSDVAAYGHTLLTVSKRRPGRLVTAAAFAESEAPLRHRILSMTTPPRTVSVLAVTASTVVAVLMLAGACQVPVPTEGDPAAAVSQPDQTPSVTVVDTPPTPPSTPQPDVEIPAVDSSAPVPEPTPPPAAPEVAAAPVQASPAPQGVSEPEFSPMTVRPALNNVDEVMAALLREYPPVLRDAGIGGTPTLWIHIATDGTVDDTRIYESSGYQPIDEAAQAVARAMRFNPAENRGETVAVWVQIPIRFAAVN